MKYVRAKDGVIFGVCKGVARAFDIPVGICRLLWVMSVLLFGVGLGVYFLLAITLPREDKIKEALQPWILGVCLKISERTQLEVGIVRFLAVIFGLASLGATAVGYVVLYFVLEDRNSANNPTNPPSIT